MANVIEFTLKTKDLASAGIKKFASGVGSAAKTVAKFTAVGAAAATAVFAFTKSVANAQDIAGKFAFRIGKSVENLTAYQHVANLAGVETRTFNMALQRMERRVAQAAEGTGEAVTVLRDFGIEAGAFAKLGIDEQMQILADKFQGMGDSTAAVTSAFKLFDSEGVAMLQMLKQGSTAMQDMAAEAETLGLVVSEKAAANSAAFNDSLTKLWGAITGASRAVINELIPALVKLSNAMTDFIVDNRDDVTEFFDNMKIGMIAFGIIANEVLTKTKNATNTAFSGNVFKDYATNAKSAVIFVGKVMINGMNQVGKVMRTALMLSLNGIKSFAKATFNGVFALLKGESLKPVLDELLKGLNKNLEKAAKEFEDAFSGKNQIFELTIDAPDEIKDIFDIDLDGVALKVAAIIKELNKIGKATTDSNKNEEEKQKTFLQSLSDNYGQYMNKQKTITEQFSIETSQIMISATQSIGDAFAASIVQSQNLGEALKNVANQVLQSIISMLIKVGIQRLAAAALDALVTKKKVTTELAAQAAISSAHGFNAMASLGLVGLSLAPAAGAAASASMLAGATSAGLAGKAAGAAIAHGGLDYVPSEQTYLLNKGERVLSPNQNRDLTSFLGDGSGRSVGNVTIEKIEILPNATNAEALLNMPPEEMRRVVEEKILDALDDLYNVGIKQAALA